MGGDCGRCRDARCPLSCSDDVGPKESEGGLRTAITEARPQWAPSFPLLCKLRSRDKALQLNHVGTSQGVAGMRSRQSGAITLSLREGL